MGAADLSGDRKLTAFGPLLDDWSHLELGLVPPGPRVDRALRTSDEIEEPCMPVPTDE